MHAAPCRPRSHPMKLVLYVVPISVLTLACVRIICSAIDMKWALFNE